MNFFSSALTSRDQLHKKYGLDTSKLSFSELTLAQDYIKKTTRNVRGFESHVFFKFLLKQAIKDEHTETLLLLICSDVFTKNPMIWFKLAVGLRKDNAATLFIYESCINLKRVIFYLVQSDKLELLKVAINYTKIRRVDYTISIIEAIHWNKEQIIDILLSNSDIETSQCLETAVKSSNLIVLKAILSHGTLCPNYSGYIGYITALAELNYAAAIHIVNHCKFRVTAEHIEQALSHRSAELFKVLLLKKPTFNPKIVYRAITSQDMEIINIVIQCYHLAAEPILGIICKYDFAPGLSSLIKNANISMDLALTISCKYGALECIQSLLANPACVPELNLNIVHDQVTLLNFEVIQLLDTDGRVNLETNQDALFIEACKQSKLDIIKIIVNSLKSSVPAIKTIDYMHLNTVLS